MLTHITGPSSLETIGVPSTSKAATPPPQTAAEAQSAYAQQLADVPEFTEYGQVLNSSAKPSQLTEAETEYQVSCVKHIFKEHIVFQVHIYTSFPRLWFSANLICDSSMWRIRSRTQFWNRRRL